MFFECVCVVCEGEENTIVKRVKIPRKQGEKGVKKETKGREKDHKQDKRRKRGKGRK